MVAAPFKADNEDIEDPVRRSGYVSQNRHKTEHGCVDQQVRVNGSRSCGFQNFAQRISVPTSQHARFPHLLLSGYYRGAMFLLPSLIPRLRALQNPLVSRQHRRIKNARTSIAYFRNTWIEGAFEDIWCKWKLEELRTTNLPEAFHIRLGLLIDAYHPPSSVLIETLRKLNYEARAALKRLEKDPPRQNLAKDGSGKKTKNTRRNGFIQKML
ncbi:hypothetical protein GCK32_000289 [Trichostrongylus colubriformis]|uniref:Uncharacterized protein n=1 Tax=Trichostrongylus colubriformis TaxID=6319 RepID=A0AAN8EX70_TRICO